MARFKTDMAKIVASMGGSRVEALKAARGAEVRAMWEDLMRHNHLEIILDHTNNVFIINPEAAEKAANRAAEKAAEEGADADVAGNARSAINVTAKRKRYHDDGKDASATGHGKQLIVYVDDSIVSAELNARRELIKLQFLEHYGEAIDEFKIIISRGQYKKNHPFIAEAKPSYIDEVAAVALDEGERAGIAEELEQVEDERLRRSLEKAMIADLEWKKGLERARQRGETAGGSE